MSNKSFRFSKIWIITYMRWHLLKITPRGLLEKNEIEMEVNSRMKNEMIFNLA